METARSYQLVASKTFNKTDVKLTLGHETQTAEYGKIDPDQGLQFDLGPGRIRYLAVTLRQSFPYGSLQATFEQADARLVNTSFSVVPEAPRLIGDLTGTYQKLPFHLQAKGEFEYVGRKVVGNGCSESSYGPMVWAWHPKRCGTQLLLPGRAEQRVSPGGGAVVHGWKDQRRREHDDCQRLDRADNGELRYDVYTWRSGSWEEFVGARKPGERGGWRSDSLVCERELHLLLGKES